MMDKISKAMDHVFFFCVIMIAMVAAFVLTLKDLAEGNYFFAAIGAVLVVSIAHGYLTEWRHRVK